MIECLKKELESIKKFDLSGYEEIEVIGSGSYGRACLYHKDSRKIVIKEFFYYSNPDTLELIKREIINQSECYKENLIVSFLGISFNNPQNKPLQIPLLIMEYGESGSLAKLDKSSIDDIEKMIIIYGVAKGLQFLHHMSICHRDLNPKNIVLDSHKYPLICDFGHSRQISLVHINEGSQRGTPLYMSPEMLKSDEITTEVFLPSDVFSFGLIIFNMLTNKEPYLDEIEGLNIFSLSKFLNSGKRAKLPDSIPSWFRYLIKLCWKQEPNERPSIDDIVNLFDAGIALPLIYEDEEKSAKYFEYINEHLHLNIGKMNKDKLALAVDFMLADYFNDSNAQTNLGYYYFNGYLVDNDYKKSIEYFKKAAENEDPRSLFYLSEIFQYVLVENGIDVDLAESDRNFQRAAELGYKPAVEFLERNQEFSGVNKSSSPTVIVLGERKVGKTSFISRILNKNIYDPLLFPASLFDHRYYYLPVYGDENKKYFIRLKKIKK